MAQNKPIQTKLCLEHSSYVVWSVLLWDWTNHRKPDFVLNTPGYVVWSGSLSYGPNQCKPDFVWNTPMLWFGSFWDGPNLCKPDFIWNTPGLWLIFFGMEKFFSETGQTNTNQTLSGTLWVCGLVWFSLGRSKPIRKRLFPEYYVAMVRSGSLWASPNQHEPGFVWKPLEM
ncbi:unnamed protein product [Timema podura]|uniref:Uncharacterized protein n=1 Tax=Timema podura TaxID=61482 RepID=A0ABN7PLX5_TIMPD|nr:unnamed protein product [Timema podura]